MSQNSHIEWTDASWNPVAGCTAVSPGCANCYAASMTRRLQANPKLAIAYAGLTNDRHFTGKIALLQNKLDLPLKWKKPRRIFVNSMSDLFHPDVPFEFIDKVFAVMNATIYRIPLQLPFMYWHTYQILTKRPERAAEYLASREPGIFNPGAHPLFAAGRGEGGPLRGHGSDIMNAGAIIAWPLANVWIGTSVENQAAADERIPHLLRCPAAVRFLSCEPLLGPVDLRQKWVKDFDGTNYEGVFDDRGMEIESGIQWLIAGGESGPHCRPCNFDWIRSLRDQCQAAGVPIFIKQLGGNPHGMWEHGEPPKYHLTHRNGRSEVLESKYKNGRWKLRDRAGRWMDEWPEDLRIREYPEVAT